MKLISDLENIEKIFNKYLVFINNYLYFLKTWFIVILLK